MTAPTHVTFAEFVYLLVLTTTGISLNPVNAAVIAVSSLLPDVDTAASTIGKLIPIVSLRIERRFGHRTITHSAICIAGIAIVTFPVSTLSSDLYACLVVGYGSHAVLDTMTLNGVKLFYPFSTVKCVFPLEVNNPHRYRIQTGGKMDKALAVIFLAGCVPTFIIAYQGYERFIRVTQHNIEAAVRDYNEFSKDHLVFAAVRAYDMLTKQPLEGRVEVVGALNAHTLVFKGPDGRVHTLGKDFQADFVAQNILCTRGGAAHSWARTVDMSNEILSQIMSYIDSSAENYLFGDLSTTANVSLPENIRVFTPVSRSAGAMRFNYATVGDIRSLNLENLVISKGILTIKSIVKGALPITPQTAAVLPVNDYAQVSSTVEANESVIILKHKGDTLRENEVVLRKSFLRFFESEIALLREQIGAAADADAGAIAEIEQKTSELREAARIDSTECSHAAELLKNGFIAGGGSDKCVLKVLKDKREISGLIASKAARSAKTRLEILRLNLRIRELAAKQKEAELQSEVRSPFYGILAEIRRIPHDGKIQLTLVIRRLR